MLGYGASFPALMQLCVIWFTAKTEFYLSIRVRHWLACSNVVLVDFFFSPIVCCSFKTVGAFVVKMAENGSSVISFAINQIELSSSTTTIRHLSRYIAGVIWFFWITSARKCSWNGWEEAADFQTCESCGSEEVRGSKAQRWTPLVWHQQLDGAEAGSGPLLVRRSQKCWPLNAFTAFKNAASLLSGRRFFFLAIWLFPWIF